MQQSLYPVLAEFIASWFHQDFDLEGETVADVVGAYRASTPTACQVSLHQDIARFVADHPVDLESSFETLFRPDVIPAAFSGSTRAFLDEIQRLLPSS